MTHDGKVGHSAAGVEADDGTDQPPSAEKQMGEQGQSADGLDPPPPRPPRATLPHYKTSPRSTQPLPIVPSEVGQKERADVLDALRDTSLFIKPAAACRCHVCNLHRHPDSKVETIAATVKCGEAVAVARVEVRRCTESGMRIILNGRGRGVVFQSASTLYCEAFLFELAVDFCRNGCSLS